MWTHWCCNAYRVCVCVASAYNLDKAQISITEVYMEEEAPAITAACCHFIHWSEMRAQHCTTFLLLLFAFKHVLPHYRQYIHLATIFTPHKCAFNNASIWPNSKRKWGKEWKENRTFDQLNHQRKRKKIIAQYTERGWRMRWHNKQKLNVKWFSVVEYDAMKELMMQFSIENSRERLSAVHRVQPPHAWCIRIS